MALGIIRHLILTNILTMDKALSVLMELVFGDKSPEELCNKFLAA